MNPDASLPTVSVCVVTHNQESYIQACLASVLSQSVEVHIEVLVGDDASTDGTCNIVERVAAWHPGAITLYRHVRNLGAPGNYQFLVQRAKGLYIAHLDGDDYWLPGKLARQLQHFSKHPECAAAYTNAVVVSENGQLHGAFNNEQPENFDSDYLLERGNFLHHSSLLYPAALKTCLLAIAGPFIDYQLHLSFARAGTLGYVNEVLTVYRIGHPGAMTTATPNRVHDLYWQALVEGLRHTDSPRVARRALQHFWAQSLVRHWLSNEQPGGMESLRVIRCDASEFGAVDVARGLLYAFAILCNLFAAWASRIIYRSRVRLLHRR